MGTKKKMDFDFSVFGCNADAARAAFEAAGYDVRAPVADNVARPGDILDGGWTVITKKTFRRLDGTDANGIPVISKSGLLGIVHLNSVNNKLNGRPVTKYEDD